MLNNLFLINLLVVVVSSKTLLVPIDYEYTLDVYYNFKNNPSIEINPVSEGLQIFIPDSYSNSTYYQKRAISDCNDLSEGMVVLNIDKSNQNALITWDQYNIFHLIDASTGNELTYNSVIQQDCSNELETTTLGSSSFSSSSSYIYSYSISHDAVDTFIGSISTGHPLNHTTYVPLNYYSNSSSTETFYSTNSVGSVVTSETVLKPSYKQTTTYGPSNTLAILAPARSTTTTIVSYSSGSTYTILSTITSCQQHAMGGCSVETLSSEIVGGSTVTPVSLQTELSAITTVESDSSSNLQSSATSTSHSSITVSYKTSAATSTIGIQTSYDAGAGHSVREKSLLTVILAVLVSFII